MNKSPLFLIIFLSIIMLTPSIAHAALNFTDDFNSGIHSFWWEVSAPGDTTVVAANQRIEMTQGASESSGGLSFKHTIIGDFTATVDYTLLYWPSNNLERLAISSSLGAVERISDSRFGGEVYLTHFGSTITSTGTQDMSGSLKMSRVGGVLSGYYWNAGNWTLINSVSMGTADATVGLSIWPWGATSGVKVAFDNFNLNAPRMTVTPEPVSAMLFSIGGFALAFFRKKVW